MNRRTAFLKKINLTVVILVAILLCCLFSSQEVAQSMESFPIMLDTATKTVQPLKTKNSEGESSSQLDGLVTELVTEIAVLRGRTDALEVNLGWLQSAYGGDWSDMKRCLGLMLEHVTGEPTPEVFRCVELINLE